MAFSLIKLLAKSTSLELHSQTDLVLNRLDSKIYGPEK